MKLKEALAKLDALSKDVLTKLNSNMPAFFAPDVYHLFDIYISIRNTLIDEYPSLFDDLHRRTYPKASESQNLKMINRHDLDNLRSDIGYCHRVISLILAEDVPPENQNPYVDIKRIEELEKIGKDKFDLMKLIEFCKELNRCHSVGAVLAIPLLVRSILDHVPPIFNMETFVKVANNYSFTKSNKGLILKLQESSRKIADSILHTQIRKKEALPTRTQVDFKNALDVLLQEIVRILKD